MSFGIGVGDLIALIKLANNIKERLTRAPDQLRACLEESATPDHDN
jgi:hypothetical protein